MTSIAPTSPQLGGSASRQSLIERVRATKFPPSSRISANGYPTYRRVIDEPPPSGFAHAVTVILADVAGVNDREVVAYVLYHGDFYPPEPGQEDKDGARQLIRSLADIEPYGPLLQCRLLSAKERFNARSRQETKRPRRKW